MENEKTQKKIHFIGICGVGMSALAVMLKEQGNTISGSDDGFYEPTASYLKDNGIAVLSPHKKENIPKSVDIIVIGRHSKLNAEENEEVRFALTTPKKIKSFPEILSEITKDRENIVVVGSYGKSTCASLMTWCLLQSGVEAGYFFGAIPIGFKKSAQIGKEKYFVLEGDEYPAYASSGESKSKFLYMHPTHILLTAAEHDHINVFPTLESYLKPYKELLELLPEDGLLVAGIDNPNVRDVVGSRSVVTYGVSNNTSWHAKNIRYGKETSFVLCKGAEEIVELSTSLLGEHNIENIVGVSAFLLEKNLITIEQLQGAILTFGGLKRRLDLKTDESSVLVYEGFGSSYTKAKTVFDAVKLHFPKKRIVTIFEPHTFSWRNKNNLHWYDDVFEKSDITLVLKPALHGQGTHEQAELIDILEQIRKNKNNVYGVENKEETMEILEKTVKADDLIVLMSSGDLGGLIEKIPTWVEKKFPR